jgi:glycosyltransferase involved in cell wall biosynthesis
MEMRDQVAVVIIGRNEGSRLLSCLQSLVMQAPQIVYVDSGSTDDSVNTALNAGAVVVALDMAVPFTAARARNEGFERVRKLYPLAEYVQFVDGDCEVAPEWLKSAVDFLDEHQAVAAVCGRRSERFPEKTIYNQLCDMEWDTPVGETKACGGDVLMRMRAFESVHGFRSDLIAGEEPELCVRLRANRWKIWRIDQEMTIHDAAMTKFSQWWKRSMRAGHAFAEGAYLHGAPPERHWVLESRRIWIWGFVIPVAILLIGLVSFKLSVFILLIYPLQIVRLGMRSSGQVKNKWIRAVFLVLGKFPEMVGQLKFYQRLWSGKQGRLIEYK